MSENMKTEPWEKEIYHKTRVHGFDGHVDEIHARLRLLWKAAQPLTKRQEVIVDHIRLIRQCNWRLEDAVWDLCEAIGSGDTSQLRLGHSGSITDERWQKYWAYYIALQNWLPRNFDPGGYTALLRVCDPVGKVQNHVLAMLGNRTELKELYVKRFCLWLEWTVIGGMFDLHSSAGLAHTASVEVLEKRIQELDPEGDILPWLLEDHAHTELCHHKAFRRYDIVISSIGAGKWRAAMPQRSTAGADLIEMHNSFIQAIDTWFENSIPAKESILETRVHELLGAPDAQKRFLAAFLKAVLVAQKGNIQAHLQKNK